MKRMTGIRACAALLCVLLTACARQEDVSAAPNALASAAGGASGLMNTLPALPFSVGTLYETDWGGQTLGCSDGKAFYSIATVSAVTDERMYMYQDRILLRLDYETRVQAPLCAVPGCAHADASCPAYVSADGFDEDYWLAVVEGRLYLLRTGWSDALLQADGVSRPTVWIDRVATDGTGRARLVDLPTGWTLNEPPQLTDGAALFGQYTDQSDQAVHGVRIDLENGEYTSFSFGLDSGEKLLGAAGKQFILYRNDSVMSQMAYPEVMGQELYQLVGDYNSPGKNNIYRFDPATGARGIVNWLLKPSELQAATSFYGFIQQGKYYYYLGSEERQSLWEHDLVSGVSRPLVPSGVPADSGWFFVEPLRLFPSGSGSAEPYLVSYLWANGSVVYLISVSDGGQHRIGLQYETSYGENEYSIPRAQTESGLWLVPTGRMDTVWGPSRYTYGLARPETVFSGEGEVLPVQMWNAPQALG